MKWEQPQPSFASSPLRPKRLLSEDRKAEDACGSAARGECHLVDEILSLSLVVAVLLFCCFLGMVLGFFLLLLLSSSLLFYLLNKKTSYVLNFKVGLFLNVFPGFQKNRRKSNRVLVGLIVVFCDVWLPQRLATFLN